MSRRSDGRPDDGRSGREESSPVEDRYAGVETEAGLLVYDTRNEAAWVESDTALVLTETR